MFSLFILFLLTTSALTTEGKRTPSVIKTKNHLKKKLTKFPTHFPTRWKNKNKKKKNNELTKYLTQFPTQYLTKMTDVSNCLEWNCEMWCNLYDERNEYLYTKYGCLDDGTSCVC